MKKKVISKIKAPEGYRFEVRKIPAYYNNTEGLKYLSPEYNEAIRVATERNKYIQDHSDINGAYFGEQDIKLSQVRIILVEKKRGLEMGNVNLAMNVYSNSFHTHSFLHATLHNKGFGTLLYARAIQWALENGFTVRNSGSSSDLAQRVWRGKSLRKYFRIVTKHNKYRKEPRYDVFYAYPLLKSVKK